MWFDTSMTPIYDQAFDPAIRAAGYHPIKIDLKHHNNKIDDEIIAEIRQSRFVVADFTGNRGGSISRPGSRRGSAWTSSGLAMPMP
jgi:hypothetical protein